MIKFQKRRQKNKGFTIIEVLLSVMLISLIAGIGIPVFQVFQNRNELDVATTSIIHSMRRAQVLSQSMDGDTTWGLYIQNGSITLYKGLSYATRDTGFDEIFEIPENINISGTQEYLFLKFTGEPQVTGTTILTSINNETREVTLNNKGMIEY